MHTLRINTVQIINALSSALELAVDGLNWHQRRTAIICRSIAEEIGMPHVERNNLIRAALLHDIGAEPGTGEVELLAVGREVRLGKSIHEHALTGYFLLTKSEIFRPMAKIVLHHHDSWCGNNPSGLAGEEIPMESRIMHLADYVEISLDDDSQLLGQGDAIRENVQAESGGMFDPALVAAFLKSSMKDSFWLDLSRKTHRFPLTTPQWAFGEEKRIGFGEALNVAELYATLIDRVSAFTATHSRSVSAVGALLAGYCGFSEDEQSMIRIAGLLHDIGKLSVPNRILEKPGPLDVSEKQTVRQHAYYTYRILEQVQELGVIAKWAAFHHETLDGEGYPFRLSGKAIPMGSRIIAVADIFVALVEDRPYRKSLHKEEVEFIMRGMASDRKIDCHVVAMLLEKYTEADRSVLRGHVPDSGLVWAEAVGESMRVH